MRHATLTPNERELLAFFKDVNEANAVIMCKKMFLSLHYTQTLCNRLVASGVLSVVSSGRWPVYTANGKEVKVVKEARITKRVKRTKIVLKPKVEVKCAYCKGKGRDPWQLMSPLSNCQVCNGKGTVKIEEPFETCPVCKGRGNERNKKLSCLTCKGKGVVHIEKAMKTCPECGGSGMTGSVGLRKYCLTCKGIGKVRA